MRARLVLAVAFAVLLASLGLPSPPGKSARAQAGDGLIVELGSAWNVGSLTSGSAVFASDLTPTHAASCVRIGIVLGTTAQASIRETDGTHTFTSFLNGGTALTAGTMYTFVWECRNANAPGGKTGPTGFNFVVNGPTAVPICRATEVLGPAD